MFFKKREPKVTPIVARLLDGETKEVIDIYDFEEESGVEKTPGIEVLEPTLKAEPKKPEPQPEEEEEIIEPVKEEDSAISKITKTNDEEAKKAETDAKLKDSRTLTKELLEAKHKTAIEAYVKFNSGARGGIE